LYNPTFDGAKVTAQEAVAPVPERVHEAEEKVPALFAEKVTVPDGVTGVPEVVSETVAVHVTGAPL